MENLNTEQIIKGNSELYDYVKRIVVAVKYNGDGDHEDVPSILRMFAKGYEQRIKQLTEEVASWKEIAEGYQKQFEDCAEDRAKLTEENERLREKADRNLVNLKAVLEERSETAAGVAADAVQRFADRLKTYYNTQQGHTPCPLVAYHINQIAEEVKNEWQKSNG